MRPYNYKVWAVPTTKVNSNLFHKWTKWTKILMNRV
jgi:hypothetical protein